MFTTASRILCVLVILMALAGCRRGNAVAVSGTLLKDGKPYTFVPNEVVQIFFRKENDQYMTVSTVDSKTGRFVVTGQEGSGVPPGNYLICLQSVLGSIGEDRFEGKFDEQNSKLKYTFTGKSENIKIDVGTGTVSK